MSSLLMPCILAGGSGTRLWPLSREQYPKQFLSLVEQQSLLQVTARRAGKLADVTPPVVICGEDQRFLVAEQMRAGGFAGATTLIEPAGRNTAPALTLAALQAQHGATRSPRAPASPRHRHASHHQSLLWIPAAGVRLWENLFPTTRFFL